MGSLVRKSTEYQELAAKYGRTGTALREAKGSVEKPGSATNLTSAACIVAGGTAAGVVRGVAGASKGGIPTDAALGILTIGAAFGFGSPKMLFAGAGMLAAFASNAAETGTKNRVTKPSNPSSETDKGATK